MLKLYTENISILQFFMINLFLAIAIIQRKGYGEITLGYQPTYGLQILYTDKNATLYCEWAHLEII